MTSDGGRWWWAKRWTARVMVANDAGWWGWKVARPFTVVWGKLVHLWSVGRPRKEAATRPARSPRPTTVTKTTTRTTTLAGDYRRACFREAQQPARMMMMMIIIMAFSSSRGKQRLPPRRTKAGTRLTNWSLSTSSASNYFREPGGARAGGRQEEGREEDLPLSRKNVDRERERERNSQDAHNWVGSVFIP